MKIAHLSLEELGGLICQTLSDAGIDAVLSGGSCVSIWTDNLYSSNDMDMITMTLASQYQLSAVLESIGFKPVGRTRYFEHPDSAFALEFPSGPLMVGDEQIRDEQVHRLETTKGTLKLLSPTDCVKDRLAACYHWKDRQSWEQAVSVAKRHPPDWASLALWHKNEGELEAFSRFRDEVEKR